jgi:transcriptional regulator with XRE-family HTH domain
MGKILKRLRIERGLSRAELAERANLTREYIFMLEEGQRRNPSFAVMVQLAKALNVEVMALATGQGRKR